jgi:hypothetical protein
MMAVDVRSEASIERRLAKQVRQAALREIEARSLSSEELAALVGASRTAVYLLSLNESWPLSVSVQVAEALGLGVELTISESTDECSSSNARAA